MKMSTCPEGQFEGKEEETLRKNKKKIVTIWGKIKNVERLPTLDCEAGYTPVVIAVNILHDKLCL